MVSMTMESQKSIAIAIVEKAAQAKQLRNRRKKQQADVAVDHNHVHTNHGSVALHTAALLQAKFCWTTDVLLCKVSWMNSKQA